MLKLFVAGKQADLVLSAGDYHMKFNRKNFGNELIPSRERGSKLSRFAGGVCSHANYLHREIFQQLQLPSVEGLKWSPNCARKSSG